MVVCPRFHYDPSQAFASASSFSSASPRAVGRFGFTRAPFFVCR